MKRCENESTGVRVGSLQPLHFSIRDKNALVQPVSVATPSGRSHARRSKPVLMVSTTVHSLGSILWSGGPTESEKIVEHSTIISAIKAQRVTRTILRAASGGRGGRRFRSVVLASGLLLDSFSFDRLRFDRGARFGFDVPKTFVVVGVEIGARLGTEIIKLTLFALRTG